MRPGAGRAMGAIKLLSRIEGEQLPFHRRKSAARGMMLF
jgi:hypothetical protein